MLVLLDVPEGFSVYADRFRPFGRSLVSLDGRSVHPDVSNSLSVGFYSRVLFSNSIH